MQHKKDFSSVSPSAKSLLLMKALTDIPYAKETAALMQGPEVFGLDFNNKDLWFWIRVMHMESRYKSIDQLLQQADCRNILELSSGYSFRGLDMCKKDERIHYIDTDLPEVVEIKQNMIEELHLANGLKGRFELAELNAIDEAAFTAVTARFGDGALAVINEGLLMYLNTEEKKQLCKVIHNVLARRGGCWITADVYVKRPENLRVTVPQAKGEAEFFEQHKIEENKFDSYEAAAAFFAEQGFEMVKEASPDYRTLTSMPHLLKVLPEEMRNSKEPPPKIQATWMLRPV